jgi:hypothetical protein
MAYESGQGRSPARNPAAEVAGHLLLASALAEKVTSAIAPERRAEVDALVRSIEDAIELAYGLVPAVQEASERRRLRAPGR